MPAGLKQYLPYLILFVLTALFTLAVFGDLAFHPNQYLFAAGGDGLKSYFSSIYFVKFSEGVTNTGLAYPFGNHAVYADQNPILSLIIRWFSHNIKDISGYTVGIINLTVIFSFFPAVFFLYKILRRSLLPAGYAVAGALLIAFFSPQIERFTGHYSLSYIFFVPMLWYFLIRMLERKRYLLWAGLYFLAALFFGMAHPYHLLIGGAFMTAVLLVHSIRKRRNVREWWPVWLSGILAALLPMVIFRVWVEITYPGAHDFVRYPYGFMHYLASFESLFLPKDPPLWDFWNFFIDVKKANWEGYAYVGFGGLLILVFSLLRLGNRFSRMGKRKRLLRPALPESLRLVLLPAILLLIPAMGFPFKLVPGLADTFAFVRQFRSLGRLAWPFYYVFMSFGLVWLYQFYRHLSGKGLRLAGATVLALFLLIWSAEAFILIKHKRDHFLQNSTLRYDGWNFDLQQSLAGAGRQPEDFQAILALPFYHIGSEKLSIGSENWASSFYSYVLSKSTGLPICNNYVARAPLSESFETIQLVSDPLIRKTLPGKFPDRRPLLLLQTPDPLPSHERRLVSQAKLIAETDRFRLLELPLSAFDDIQTDYLAKFRSEKDSLLFPENGGVFLSKAGGNVILEGFGDGFFETPLGEGPDIFTQKGKTLLFEGSLTGISPETEMEASVWVRLDRESNYLPPLVLQQFAGDSPADKHVVEMKSCTDIIGNWARASVRFKAGCTGCRIELFAEGRRLAFDNLLIRPADTDVWVEREHSLVVNNFPLETGGR